jgi:hypothetical protein
MLVLIAVRGANDAIRARTVDRNVRVLPGALPLGFWISPVRNSRKPVYWAAVRGYARLSADEEPLGTARGRSFGEARARQ